MEKELKLFKEKMGSFLSENNCGIGSTYDINEILSPENLDIGSVIIVSASNDACFEKAPLSKTKELNFFEINEDLLKENQSIFQQTKERLQSMLSETSLSLKSWGDKGSVYIYDAYGNSSKI